MAWGSHFHKQYPSITPGVPKKFRRRICSILFWTLREASNSVHNMLCMQTSCPLQHLTTNMELKTMAMELLIRITTTIITIMHVISYCGGNTCLLLQTIYRHMTPYHQHLNHIMACLFPLPLDYTRIILQILVHHLFSFLVLIIPHIIMGKCDLLYRDQTCIQDRILSIPWDQGQIP